MLALFPKPHIPCNFRSLRQGPCHGCKICTKQDRGTQGIVEEIWKDNGEDVIGVLVLDSETFDQLKFEQLYLPYISRLESVKPRTYLVLYHTDRSLSDWICRAVPEINRQRIHYPDCKDSHCRSRNILPTAMIPYHAWTAFDQLGSNANNPRITYGRNHGLWSQAITMYALYPEGTLPHHSIQRWAAHSGAPLMMEQEKDRVVWPSWIQV